MTISQISIIILSFVISILLSKKGKEKSDYILLIWFVMISVHLLVFLQLDGVIAYSQGLYTVNEAAAFTHGPLLYWYTISLCRPSRKLKPLQFGLHFLPSIIVLLIYALLNNISPYWGIIFTLLKIVSLLTYTFFSFQLIRTYKVNLKQILSNIEKTNLNWLYFLCIGIIALVVISSGILIVENVIGTSLLNGYNTSNIILCLFVVLLGFWGIQQAPVFINIDEVQTKESSIKPNVNDKLGEVSSEKHKHLYQKILHHFDNEKPYLNPNLNLQELAYQLDIPSYLISQIINTEAGEKFFDFVNGKRIRHFKQLIFEGRHHETTILALAYSSGFNSKSAFNRAFKKSVGITPSEFIKNESSDNS